MISSDVIKEKGPELLEIIKASKKVLLHLHPRPDGDSIGSALGMKHTLTEMGKEVTVIKGDSPLPAYLSHLPGFDTIVQKNIFEIDLSAFDLFLIQDSGSMDQISNLGPIIFPPTLKTVCIDHHVSNTGYGQLNLVDSAFPAVCDLLVSLLVSWGITINTNAALCFMIGIFTDTGGFRYRGVTSRTFSNAALLAEIAPDFSKILFAMDNSNTKEKFVYEGLAFSSIHTYVNGRVAISEVSYADLQAKNIPREATKAEVSNLLKSVVGWDIGVSAVEEAPGEIKFSMRTRDPEKLDLSVIALELGGGGHKGAAGIFMKDTTLREAVDKLVAVITKLYGPVLL